MSGHGDPIPMTASASGPLKGEAHVPGDKSISHRSLILGAMSVGETRISGLLEGQDVLDTAKAMRAFGADVTEHGGGEWSVHGVGVGGFAEPEAVIDCGNSGTGVRLIMGTMATSAISATFTGDASLRSRPMARITDPLALFGTRSFGRKGGRLPMTLVGAADPTPVQYTFADAVRPGEICGSFGGPERARRNRCDRARGDPRPYRADAGRIWRRDFSGRDR